MKTVIFSLLFFLYCNYGYSQHKKIAFKYIVKNPIYRDSSKCSYIGEEHEFESNREYLNDSVFIETGVFSSNKSIIYKFMIRNGIWFIERKGRWDQFFNDSVKTPSYINISNISFVIKWELVYICNKESIYRMKLLPPKNITISDMAVYYFNPKFGFIGIEGEINLIRQDYKIYPCSIF